MMKKVFLVLTVFFIFSVIFNYGSSIGYASCAQFDIVEALKKDDAIFSGKVIKIKSKAMRVGQGYYDLVLFEVESIWKGLTESQVILRNNSQFDNVVTSIDSNFEVGESYLVYAHKLGTQYLQTNTCEGTKLLSGASEDLAFLGEGEKPTKNVSLEDALGKGNASTEQGDFKTEFKKTIPYVGVVVVVILGFTAIIWRRVKN